MAPTPRPNMPHGAFPIQSLPSHLPVKIPASRTPSRWSWTLSCCLGPLTNTT
ncbi:putative plectin [Sesbania bispinosa]|nr:putative plectin [Sesbania bispinosa]